MAVINGLRIEKATVLRYTGKEAEIIIPKDVLRIAPFAFAGCKNLRKIVLPYKLLSIGKGAFFGCDNVKSPIRFSTSFLPSALSSMKRRA